MENEVRLNTALNTQKGHISKITIPEYITDNLAFGLREYQKEAIARFLYYKENDIYDTNGNIIHKSPHLLWQMATGSGKTLIMAALILEMYKQGYHNFWFFVNAKDIITKTIDNFINSVANKYQFTQKIEIDGQVVQIRQVENFTNSNTETINIKFSSINILHQISQPENISENSVTLEDFAECPLVLIGDEAHHLNATTKKEEEEESTWENSVQLVLKTNPKNRLFEFTATANLTNKNILAKYEDKLLYNYDLKKFREDKYSKDVFTFSTDGDPEKIIMRAILISQYRKHIGSRFALKPVILFKSKGVKESEEYFEKFNQVIQNLTVKVLKKELNNVSTGNDIWEKASHYFLKKFRDKESDLCNELRDDFDVDKKKILLHDGTNKRIADQPKLLATLEDDDNPVRAIFAVNMLSEGWDVLNLFDIVRLYDSRDGKYNKQGKYVPGTTTVSEAQLIGRGARYYPFEYSSIDDKYKRKFDDNESEPLRAIEQMHYHCKDNPRYISEIRSSLMEIGIIEDLPEIKLRMKEDFINGRNKNFQEKNVYENKIIEKEELNIEGIEFVVNEIKEQKISFLPDFSKNEPLEIDLATGFSKSQALLKNDIEMPIEVPREPFRGKLSEIVLGHNIIRYALNSNKNFNFDKLQKIYPKLESMSQFISILEQQKVRIFSHKKIEDLTPDELLFICKEVLNSLVPTIKEERKKVIVAKHFYSKNAGKSFRQEIIRKYSQNEKEETINYNWYVYENSVLTSEEKNFIKWFADNMMTQKQSGKTELEEKGWSDIYLARNEKAVKLYSWFPENLATGFEPDFVLLMKKNDVDYVFYIEPKGEHLLQYDEWKEKFLMEIEIVVKLQQEKSNETQNWKVIGLPFYNKENNNKDKGFEKTFAEKSELN